MKLKDIRILNGITQSEASSILGVSLRSYKEYENNQEKEETLKYKYPCETLDKYFLLDEGHGILSKKVLIDKTIKAPSKYKVNFCYLFGLYAKGKATFTN